MNIAKKARRDPKKMEEGVWVPWAEDARFKIRSDASEGYRFANAEVIERYRTQLNAGGQARLRALHQIAAEVCARYTIADWEGIEIEDGVPLECTEDNRLKVCQDPAYFDVVAFCRGVAAEFQPYKLQDDPETKKKSQTPSDGGEPSEKT